MPLSPWSHHYHKLLRTSLRTGEKKILGTKGEEAMLKGRQPSHFPTDSAQTTCSSNHPPLPHPHQSNLFKIIPGLCEEYLDDQRLDRAQQEEASNMTEQIQPELSSEAAGIYWDTQSFKRQGQLETSCTTEVRRPACTQTLSPSMAHDCYLSIAHIHMHHAQPHPHS